MKIRIISDLHLASNNVSWPLNSIDTLQKYKDKEGANSIHSGKDVEDDIYTLIAGDLAADADTCDKFFKAFPELKGCWVEGNHIVYNDENKTIDELYEERKERFGNNQMKFLENDVYEIPNTDFVVIGATLWTDFKLFGHDKIKISKCKRAVKRALNDYRYGIQRFDEDNNGDPEPIMLSPEYTKNFFEKSFQYINQMVKQYKDKKVIVLTHHCPSIRCSPSRYHSDLVTAGYVSNLDIFIEENPNIVMWICGHCHEQKFFKIGNTNIVMNPIGYGSEIGKKEWNLILNINDKTGDIDYES